MATATPHRYKPTESKYKGGAHESYVTYDLEQRTRSGAAVFPKVKRVYVAGDIEGWDVGDFQKRSGRLAHGVRVRYTQSRRGFSRRGFAAKRGNTRYEVSPATVGPSIQHFAVVVDVPQAARNVDFHKDQLPPKYREALQDIR